jgi:hypothetical protein
MEHKLLDRSQTSLVFHKSNYYVGENFQFQYIQFRNLKDAPQRSIPKLWGLLKVVYFIFGYFSTKLGTSVVDGHENIT